MKSLFPPHFSDIEDIQCYELVPTVSEADGRQADVFVRGMSIGNGLPVVGDMCMGSALHANGRPYTEAATVDGKAIERLTG